MKAQRWRKRGRSKQGWLDSVILGRSGDRLRKCTTEPHGDYGEEEEAKWFVRIAAS